MKIMPSFHSILIIFIGITIFIPLHAAGLGVIDGNNLVVRFDESLKNAALEVVELYPPIKEELERILGWKIDFKPSILLIKDTAKFQEITANPYVIAVAIPANHLVVIDYSKMNISPFTLQVTFKHEMCHLLLHRNIPDERLPRWLNEGFCQWVTGGITELLIDDRQFNLNKASLSNRLIPLALLSRHFPDDRSQLLLAYEESKSVVDYMVIKYGLSSVVSIMGYLKEGKSIDEATRKCLSMTLEELEKEWLQHLQGRVTWINFIAANIYTILFFVAAVLTVTGFLLTMRRRHKKRSVCEDDEDTEAR